MKNFSHENIIMIISVALVVIIILEYFTGDSYEVRAVKEITSHGIKTTFNATNDFNVKKVVSTLSLNESLLGKAKEVLPSKDSHIIHHYSVQNLTPSSKSAINISK